jgi:Zn-dependent protease with chaperone function
MDQQPASQAVAAAEAALRQAAAPSAIFFDGMSSRKRNVTLRLTDNGVDIVEDGLDVAHWAYKDLQQADGPPSVLRLASMSATPLARLEVHDPALRRDVLARCGSLAGRTVAGGAQIGRIVAWSLAAIVSIVLVTVYGIPMLAERLTPLIPASFEARMGDAGEKQVKLIFGDRVCTQPDGKAAFTKLVDTLVRAGDLRTQLQSEVLASSFANAFALAGGRIYVLDGLLQRANTVDELAGVLAHELGHVAHRDHVRAMIHNGGTSFLIGLLFGDVTGSSAAIFTTQSLFTSSYSRDAEASADTFAVNVMHKLGRSPKPLGEFLLRITGAEKGRGMSILASHPLTEARREAMTAADRPNTGPELLTPSEWRALKGVCRPTDRRG